MSEAALVVGESLIDIVRPFVRPADQPADPGSDSGGGSDLTEFPGGSPMNVAIGLGRLGRSVRLLSRIGTDVRGDRIAAHLAQSHVELVEGTVVDDATSTADATIDAEGGAHYTFRLDWTLPATVDAGPALVVHTGSIAVTLEPGGTDVVELIRRLRPTATVTYDPNPRPALIEDMEVAHARIREMIALADVVKASDEDLGRLDSSRGDVAIARDWLRLGPAIVVVTRGSGGAVAVTADHTVEIPAPTVTVADTVGAGDAFMAGLIDALWDRGLLGADRREALRVVTEADLTELLRVAVATAAVTVARPGADPPNRTERDRAIDRFAAADR